MQRDTLFLLKHEFQDGAGLPYFCPHCAEVNGVLGYFPQLKYSLDIRYVDFARPRADIVQILGEANQNCPMLILAEKPGLDALEMMAGEVNGKFFITGPEEIARYWSYVHGISRPH